MEHRRRASDCGPACDSAERGLDPSASVVLAIEDASRDADSARLGEEKAEKSRVILGIGAILPCKTVFAQRLKRSGMGWSVEGGQRIVDLRVIHLSGVWEEVHQSYLKSQRLPESQTQQGSGKKKPRKVA